MGVVLVLVDVVGIAVNAAINLAVNFRFFFTDLRISLGDRDFPCLDVHCPRLDTLVLSGHSGNISTGSVLHTAIGKGTLETITAFGPCQCAIDLGGTLLSLHIYR